MMDALARLSVDPDDLPDSGGVRTSQVFSDEIFFDGECDGEDADAVGAYTQAFLGGPLTWITMPKEYWPASWHGKYTEPVVILQRNVILLLVCIGKNIARKRGSVLVGNRSKVGNAFTSTEQIVFFSLCMWTISRWQDSSAIREACGRRLLLSWTSSHF